MTAPDSLPLHALAEDNLAAASPDLLRAMVKTRIDAVSIRSSSIGTPRYWKQSAGPPRSRAIRATAVASPPPALSPPLNSPSANYPTYAACSPWAPPSRSSTRPRPAPNSPPWPPNLPRSTVRGPDGDDRAPNGRSPRRPPPHSSGHATSAAHRRAPSWPTHTEAPPELRWGFVVSAVLSHASAR